MFLTKICYQLPNYSLANVHTCIPVVGSCTSTLNFLGLVCAAILADEMGLGKTIQVCTVLAFCFSD